MESKTMPTVEEHFDEYSKNIGYRNWTEFLEYEMRSTITKVTKQISYEYAVLFAKYHREQQLEATVNNFYTNYIGLKSKAYIKQDLENAYSEDNIK